MYEKGQIMNQFEVSTLFLGVLVTEMGEIGKERNGSIEKDQLPYQIYGGSLPINFFTIYVQRESRTEIY